MSRFGRKSCRFCGAVFQAVRGRQRFCSKLCWTRHDAAMRAGRHVPVHSTECPLFEPQPPPRAACGHLVKMRVETLTGRVIPDHCWRCA